MPLARSAAAGSCTRYGTPPDVTVVYPLSSRTLTGYSWPSTTTLSRRTSTSYVRPPRVTFAIVVSLAHLPHAAVAPPGGGIAVRRGRGRRHLGRLRLLFANHHGSHDCCNQLPFWPATLFAPLQEVPGRLREHHVTQDIFGALREVTDFRLRGLQLRRKVVSRPVCDRRFLPQDLREDLRLDG